MEKLPLLLVGLGAFLVVAGFIVLCIVDSLSGKTTSQQRDDDEARAKVKRIQRQARREARAYERAQA